MASDIKPVYDSENNKICQYPRNVLSDSITSWLERFRQTFAIDISSEEECGEHQNDLLLFIKRETVGLKCSIETNVIAHNFLEWKFPIAVVPPFFNV